MKNCSRFRRYFSRISWSRDLDVFKKTFLILLLIAGLSFCAKSNDDDPLLGFAGVAMGDPEIAAMLAGPASISLRAPDGGVNYFSGSNVYAGGPLPGETSAPMEFTITNTHEDNALLVWDLSFSGPAAGDYIVSSPPKSGLAPGESTTFAVRFVPTAMGVREATLTLKYNGDSTAERKLQFYGEPGVILRMVGKSYGKVKKGLYWNNGVITTLPAIDETQSTSANAIAMSGSDVYIVGSSRNSAGVSQAVYWKNGTLFQLPGIDPAQHSGAGDIAISGTDVYISGYSVNAAGDQTAVYWKNGVRIGLSAAKSGAHCITVSHGDVYVGGFLLNGLLLEPVYWKNGTLITLPPLETGYGSGVSDISVFGSDVYLAGFASVRGRPTYGVYWLNGTIRAARYSSTSNVYASAIDMSETGLTILTRANDIFGTHGTSMLSRNGQSIALERAPNRDHYNPRLANANSRAYEMAIHGDDVYSVGRQYRANLWKNEKLFQISEMSLHDIVVTEN